jgi:hypothetical protein
MLQITSLAIDIVQASFDDFNGTIISKMPNLMSCCKAQFAALLVELLRQPDLTRASRARSCYLISMERPFEAYSFHGTSAVGCGHG